MAGSFSPQDLFASEDSDSDATVDLSSARPESAETYRRPSDDDDAVIVIGSDSEDSVPPKQNRKQRERVTRNGPRRFKHAISSSDSDDDSRHTFSTKNRCWSDLGLGCQLTFCNAAVLSFN